MPRSTTSSSSFYETPGHYQSLTTTGQPTASVNAKQGKLSSDDWEATGHWANTAIDQTTEGATKVGAKASSSSAPSGWDSLTNDVHIAIYAVAGAVGVFLIAAVYFCMRRRKRKQEERRFHSRTKGLRESFISSPAQLQAEKEKQMSPPVEQESRPMELATYAVNYNGQRSPYSQQGQDSPRSQNGYAQDEADYYGQLQHHQQQPRVHYSSPYDGQQEDAYAYGQRAQEPVHYDPRYQHHNQQHQQQQFSWEQPYAPPHQGYR